MRSLKLAFPFSCLVLLFIFLSCKKDKVFVPTPPCPTTYIYDNNFDTVFPSNYLMTYPGSWWEYSNGTTDSCSYWEGISVFRSTYQGNCQTITEDKQILPVTNYGHISLDSYVNTTSSTQTSVIQKFYDTIVGVFINESYSVSGTNGEDNGYSKTFKKEVIELYDTFTVNGTTYSDVILVHVDYSLYYYHIFGGPHWSADYYFAKNVGIIRKSISNQGGPYVTRDLVNYYIAPH